MRFALIVFILGIAAVFGCQNLYVGNTASNTVGVVDLTTASLDPAITLTGFTGPREIAATPDGSYIFVGNQGADTLSMIDPLTNSLIQLIPSMGTLSANVLIGVVASQTTVYAAGNANRIVSMVDIATRSEVAAIDIDPSMSGGNANELALSPDGSQVWGTNTGANTVFFFSTGTTTPAVIEIPSSMTVPLNGPNGIALTATHAYVVNQGADSLTKIDRSTLMGTEIMLGGFGVSQPQDLAISPDGSTAYIVDLSSDRLYFYSLAADTVIGSVALPISSQNYGVIVSPDGSRVYVSNYSGNQISEYNVLTGAVSASTMGYSMPIGMAFYCPSRASGFCKKDTFLTQIDLINVVQWTPIVSNVPVEYLIYREGSLIGVVPDPGPYQFSDPNRKKNKPYLYSVFAKTSNNIAFVGNVTVTSCK